MAGHGHVRGSGRPSHPSTPFPSWTGGCRALGGSRERVGTQDPPRYLGPAPFMLCGETGAQSGQQPARGHTAGRPQDSKIFAPCLPASSFWSHGGTQMLKLAGPGLGPAWEGRTGNEAPRPGSSALFSGTGGRRCAWHCAHIPPRLPLNGPPQGGLSSCGARMLVIKSPPICP